MEEIKRTVTYYIPDTVVDYSHRTLHAARYAGDVFITLANKTKDFSSANLGLNNENFLKIAGDIYDRGERIQHLIDSNVKLYLKISVLDAVLKDIIKYHTHNQGTKFKFNKHAGFFEEPIWDQRLALLSQQCTQGMVSPDFVYEVLWRVLKENEKIRNMKEEERKIKSWNTRVDELQLIQKLGSPGKWNINTDIPDNEEKERSPSPVPEELEETEDTAEVEPLEAANISNNGQTVTDAFEDIADTENTNVMEHKKKNNFFRPFTKLFKTGKNQKGKETSVKTKEKLNNSNFKQVKNLLDEKNTRSHDSTTRKHADTMRMDVVKRIEKPDNGVLMQAMHDVEPESLTMQIPSNINRIVLIKDGRKIAVEI